MGNLLVGIGAFAGGFLMLAHAVHDLETSRRYGINLLWMVCGLCAIACGVRVGG